MAKLYRLLCTASLLPLAFFMLIGCAAEPTETERVSGAVPMIIGTYTGPVSDPEVEQSHGLYVTRFNPRRGTLEEPSLAARIAHPSFAAVTQGGDRLYAISAQADGEVAAYQWQPKTKKLALINSAPTRGANPCYVSLSLDGRYLAVANYVSGNIAVYTIDSETGAIEGSPQVRQHVGEGPNKQRQEGPHAHWVQWGPDSRYVYAVDLGTDEVIGYAFNSATGELGEQFTALRTAPGAGPRHMVFHPNERLVYVLNELDNSVVVAERSTDGTFTARQTLSTLPDEFTEHSQAAHIAITPDGETLYTSNRGHNSIAVFDIAQNGSLELVQWAETQGDWPRFFLPLPEYNFLLVANRNTHNIAVFEMADNGHLSYTGEELALGQPVYVAPISIP